jgi:hypothetical protein
LRIIVFKVQNWAKKNFSGKNEGGIGNNGYVHQIYRIFGQIMKFAMRLSEVIGGCRRLSEVIGGKPKSGQQVKANYLPKIQKIGSQFINKDSKI